MVKYSCDAGMLFLRLGQETKKLMMNVKSDGQFVVFGTSSFSVDWSESDGFRNPYGTESI